MPQPQPRTKLGRYEIVNELGKGAMGVVYLAKDPIIGRMVALKTLRSGFAEDDEEEKEFQERFVREAQAAGILNHPHIVTIHDIGEDSQAAVSFIAMEFIEGRNIKQLIASGKEFSHGEIARIVSQVADALDYAHSKGIIHRDVKPANVIITEDGKVKIMDFGIAKVASSNLTTTGQFLGTPNYMSPEQVTGDAIDHRADIFSLGVVLYELLTRRKPFVGENLTSISYKIVNEPITPPHQLIDKVPAEFDYVVAKAMAKDPKLRYQAAAEMAEDLKRLATDKGWWEAEWGTMVSTVAELHGGVPPPAVPAAPAEQPSSAFSATLARHVRGRRLAVLLVPAVVVVVGALAFLRWRSAQMPPPTLAPERQEQVARMSALFREGKTALERGDFNGAIAAFRALQQIDPGNVQAPRYIAEAENRRLQLMTEKDRVAAAARHLAEGKELYEAKRFEEALAAFQEVLATDPGNSAAKEFAALAGERLSLATAQLSPSPRPAPAPLAQQTAPAVSAPPVTAREKSAIDVQLVSPLPEGYLMISVDGAVVYRKQFVFQKKRLFSRSERGGTLAASLDVEPGLHRLQVWVNTPKKEVEGYQSLQIGAIGGRRHQLQIRILPDTRSIEVKFS